MRSVLKPRVKEWYFRTKYQFGREVLTYELDGLAAQFYTRSYPEFRRFQSLMGEEEILQQLLDDLQASDVFFDIGANVGTYACFAAERIGGESVIAFEPEPTNADRLEENAALNGHQIRCKRIALSDSDGLARLALAGEGSGAGEHRLISTDGGETVDVAQRRGDELVSEGAVPTPTILKIDVEGAELKVLHGLAETLSQEVCRAVYCEVHPDRLAAFNHDAEQVENTLDDHGFDVDIMRRMGDKFFLRATRA